MEQSNNSINKNSLHHGLIIGFIMILVNLVFYILSINPFINQSIGYINWVVMIAGIVVGTKIYRDKHCGGYIKYGKSFLSGFLIGLYAMILLNIYTYIFVKFFDHSLIAQMIEFTRQKMYEASSGISDEQIEAAMSFSKRFMTPGMISVSGIFNGAIMSAIFSLIISIFLKKEQPPFGTEV